MASPTEGPFVPDTTQISQMLAHVAPGYLDSQNTKSFPLELRQMIWKAAMPDPVVIIIGHEDPKEVLKHARPNLLRVCRESRAQVLRNYELFTGIPRKPFYIDYSRDEVHLLYPASRLEKHNYHNAMTRLARKVQRLIIQSPNAGILRHSGSMTWEIEKYPPTLQDNPNWLAKATIQIPFGFRRSSPRAGTHFHFPRATNLVIVFDEDAFGGEFTKLMALKAIYDNDVSEYPAARNEWRNYNPPACFSNLPVHGTTPTVLQLQHEVDWYVTSPDWQRAWALRHLALKIRGDNEFLRNVALPNAYKDSPSTTPALEKVERPQISLLYPPKGVEYDVLDKGHWGNPQPATIGGSQYYKLPELKLRYPEGLEMEEVTVDDIAKEYPWFVDWMNLKS